jgi:hypothetical protein
MDDLGRGRFSWLPRPVCKEVAVSIALPVLSHPPVARGAVCRSTRRPLSALPTIPEFMATPVAMRLGGPSFTSAVEKSLGGRLGLQQGAVGSRPVSGCTEGGVEIGAGAVMPLLATELPEKTPLFSWVAGNDPLALQRCALVSTLRVGSRLLSEYKELFKDPMSSFTASYSQKKDRPCEHCLKENRVYALPERHTRDLLSESDHGCH